MKIISILIFIFSTSIAFGQTSDKTTKAASGGGIVSQQPSEPGIIAGGTTALGGSGQMVDPNAPAILPASNRACEFRPPMSREDRELMAEAATLIQALREDPNCAIPATQEISTLNNAVTAFSEYADTAPNTRGSPDGGVPLNCHTYESDLDRRFDQFVRNVDGARYHFPRCTQVDREDAIECAMSQVATEKSTVGQRCAEWRTSETNRQRLNAGVQGYQDVVRILSGMIQNRECGNRSESTRASLLNLGLSVAGRAASFVPVGGGQLLLAGITELAQVAVRAIFGSREDNLNHADVRLRKTENFRNLACTYQAIEQRARNCDRLIIRDNIGNMQNQYNQDLVTCDIENGASTTIFDFLSDFDAISSSLRPPEEEATATPGAPLAAEPSAPNAENEILNFVVNISENNFPGTDDTFLEVGLQNAGRVNDYYQRIATDDAFVDELIRAQNERPSGARRQLFRNNLQEEQQSAREMRELLTLMQQKYNDPTNMAELQQQIGQFGGNFREAFAQTIRRGAELSGDLAEQIDARNGSIEIMAAYGRIEEYKGWQRRTQTDDPHAREFRNRLAQIQPHLREATTDFLRMSQEALRNHTSQNLTDPDARQRVWEDEIRPAIMACNNLRSGMIEFPDFNQRRASFNANQQHAICNKFNCGTGIQTFADHLRSRGLNTELAGNCNMGDCFTEYERFVCRVNENTDQALEALKNEFQNSGKVCNNSVEQLASR